MSETTKDQKKPSVDEIYHLLRRGLGHEHVDKSNVDELLQLAEGLGHTVLAEELREYRKDC